VPLIIVALLALIPLVMRVISRIVDVLIQPVINFLNTEDPQIPISPADAADMVERNIIDLATGISEAGQSGINSDRFNMMVLDTGEPYGIEQGLNLLRRGLISEDEFTKVLYYSRVRNEFLGDVLQLQWDTMSPADAIEGALKGVLDPQTAADLFARGGGQADQFQSLLDIAGNPIGVEQAMSLWNHGFINEAQATQVILHSRVNPIFESMAKLTRFKFLAPYQIVQAVKAGTATVAQATNWLLADGYPVDQVTAVLSAQAKPATETAKTISEAQIAEMYEAGAITAEDASARLVALGYHAEDTAFILSVYDERRHMSMITAAVSQVRKVYLAGRITDAIATNQLTALGIDPTTITTYLTVWKIEAASELKELTAAQIGSLYKKGAFDDPTALAKWEAMGYSADDAALLLFNYGGSPPPGSPAAIAAASTPPAATTT
jgi:hypothetical protein